MRDRFAAAEDIDPAPRTPDQRTGDPPHDPAAAGDPGPAPDDRGPPDEGEAHHARIAKAAALPLNDYGNGKRLVIHNGEDLLFVPRVGWFTWAGTHWQKDPDRLAVRRMAQALAPLILEEVGFVPKTPRIAGLLDTLAEDRRARLDLERLPPAEREEDHQKKLDQLDRSIEATEKKLSGYQKSIDRIRTHAKNAGNSGPLQHMIEEAEPTLARALEDLDADPLAINTAAGLLRFSVVDGSEDGAGKVADYTLEAPARDQLQSKLVPVAFDPDADCPRFDAFLAEVQPDPDMRAFLQRWFGLSLTGLPVQAMAFFYGMGANGKSVLTDLMAKIAGDYAATVRIESLTGTARRGGGDATPDLVPLIGARMARTSEPDQGTQLQEGLIKEMTGGEPILVRALRSDFIEIRPIFKLTMSGNHKPAIRGTDDGIWRRVMLVPFNEQIPVERRNPNLVAELMGEAPGVLNWMVEGLLSYLEIGLAPPDAVRAATEEYRRESDPLGEFLATCCVVTADPSDAIRAAELVNAFALFLLERGDTPWKNRTVSLHLADKAARWRHPETGKSFVKGKASVSQYLGLRFTDAFARRWDAAPKDQKGYPLQASGASSAAPHPDDDQ
ncbi:phage/plasmid primase, P4 family [Roseibacterium beibuensis]|uniref:DNA primase family protein n=1 Tax=[Roseibacterium] beibuensis TaxID=1193142 RepID=UPI00217CED30|nr:DNA primase family protein [Roseibacterium beibuensis]MCS6624353.1 phage/plasmid primase, P4 family [Roseibacterium beibuensis]